MNLSLRNLFIKKLTRERVVPTISVNVPGLILAITISVSLSFPKWADNSSAGAGRFSRGIKQLIHQVLLDSDRMLEHKGHKYFANPGLSLTRAASCRPWRCNVSMRTVMPT